MNIARKSIFSYSLVTFILVVGLISLFPRGVAHAGDATQQSDTGVSFSNTTHVAESTATEQNESSLLKAQPIPSPLNFSLERQNLIDQLKVKSQKGMVGYVALIGPQGQLVAYYTIRGKVSSLNSYLTTTQQGVCPGAQWHYDAPCYTVDSPDLDGSYGNNPSGVFFFTTGGSYIEWSGSYLYSNQPLSYTSQPLLVETQKTK